MQYMNLEDHLQHWFVVYGCFNEWSPLGHMIFLNLFYHGVNLWGEVTFRRGCGHIVGISMVSEVQMEKMVHQLAVFPR